VLASNEEKPGDFRVTVCGRSTSLTLKLTDWGDTDLGRLNGARQLTEPHAGRKETNGENSCVALFYSGGKRLQPECYRLSSFRV
jgi:hypothetical protein